MLAATIERSPVEILRGTVGNINNLPTLPEAATHAMEIANSPDCSLGDFAAVIERDPTLAAGILRLANGALFRIGRHLENLRQAVVRLGLRECKNLLTAVSMRSLLKSVPKQTKTQCETLWRHSFLTACLSRKLNQSLEFGYQGEEFSTGLSHDIGRILFAVGIPAIFDAADPLNFEEGPETLIREQQMVGIDHGAFGAWFADQNKLPPSLGIVARFHHQPDRTASHHNLVGLIALADDMANYVEREEKTEGYQPAQFPHWNWLSSRMAGGISDKLNHTVDSMLAGAKKETDETQGLF